MRRRCRSCLKGCLSSISPPRRTPTVAPFITSLRTWTLNLHPPSTMAAAGPAAIPSGAQAVGTLIVRRSNADSTGQEQHIRRVGRMIYRSSNCSYAVHAQHACPLPLHALQNVLLADVPYCGAPSLANANMLIPLHPSPSHPPPPVSPSSTRPPIHLQTPALERLHHLIRHLGQHRLARYPMQGVGKLKRKVDGEQRRSAGRIACEVGSVVGHAGVGRWGCGGAGGVRREG